MSHELKIGIVGLGRLGKSHAINLLHTARCTLTAACSIVPEEIEWAREHCGTHIAVFEDYDEMLAKADIDAVFLVTSTSVHAQQILKGFEAGKHVFCEKPLGVNITECREAAEKIKQYLPHRKFSMGFVRRFDASYAFAKKRIEEGAIGEPFMVRAQTSDHDDFAPFQVNFVKTGGGIFHDMNVHDIDLARWYLGSEIESVYALGGSYVHPEFDEIGDADNATVSCSFEDGKMAYISASRTAFHGHDTRAEIYGTKGIIRVGYTPAIADVEILDSHGMRRECKYTFFDRFEDAFKQEAQNFVDYVLGLQEPTIHLKDMVQATLGAEAFTRSLKEKRVVYINEI